jgi:hypothetical protein
VIGLRNPPPPQGTTQPDLPENLRNPAKSYTISLETLKRRTRMAKGQGQNTKDKSKGKPKVSTKEKQERKKEKAKNK